METTKWVLDPMHSEVQFKVKHMVISTVTGQFKNFNVEMETEGDDLSTARVSFSADVDSISTNNEQRDDKLKGEDFFDMKNHPQIKFESGVIKKITDHSFRLKGNLTMRGVTKPVTLAVSHGGTIKDNRGNIRAGFTLEGKVKRRDYGLRWNELTETGSMIVSDEVKIIANIELIKKAGEKQELKVKEERIPIAA